MPMLNTFFLLTLINYDSNVYNHIPYKPLQDCDYKQKGCPPKVDRKKVVRPKSNLKMKQFFI
jgi:hypothetical protein